MGFFECPQEVLASAFDHYDCSYGGSYCFYPGDCSGTFYLLYFLNMKHRYLKVIGLNVLVLFAMLGALEISARLFTRLLFIGNSSNLFDVAEPQYVKNCKSCEAVSFNQTVILNQFGHRAPSRYDTALNSVNPVIAIIGDSVTFGPGVKYANTFASSLEKSFPDLNFQNTSVIGHSLEQHLITAKKLVGQNKRPEKIYLVYCLNDLSSASTSEIAALSIVNKAKNDWASKINSTSIGSNINHFLRDKSKLYLFIKGEITNPAKRHFYSDLGLYTQQDFQERAKNLTVISTILSKNNIPFKVLIMPYSYQLESSNENVLLPQKLLKDYLVKNNINYFDAYHEFAKPQNSNKLFLPYDPMHLSEEGHKILASIIKRDLTNSMPSLKQ